MDNQSAYNHWKQIEMGQEIMKLQGELSAAKAELAEYAKTVAHMRDGARLQDSATAAVMERAERAEAELAACREDAERLDWCEKWQRFPSKTRPILTAVEPKWTIASADGLRQFEGTTAREAIDAARKEGA